MTVRPLPPNPSLAHLKYQARDLLREHAAHDLAAAQRIREFHPRFSAKTDAKSSPPACGSAMRNWSLHASRDFRVGPG
jgi:hypothetical protein